MNFLHYFTPNPIAFSLGVLNIHWYGLIIALALLISVGLALFLLKSDKPGQDDFLDLALWTVIVGIIGARLYDALIIDWVYFYRQPVKIFYIWQGGLAIHGAIIGGLISLMAWCLIKKQDYWRWLDLAVIILPLAQAIGRWGNYFNQELFGRPTAWPWGIPIAENLRPAIYQSFLYFQPAFLYESILDLLLFICLMILYRKKVLKTGQFFAVYLIGYGLIRFVMEFIRIDQTALIYGYRAPQIVSLILAGAGLIIFRVSQNKKIKI